MQDKYLDLIGAVKATVDEFGVRIISTPKFWYVLSDYYHFSSNIVLRNIYKECISRGYIRDIVRLQGEREMTESRISSILTHSGIKSPGNELDAVLFSVAIGVGTFSEKDYLNFLVGKRESKKKDTVQPASADYSNQEKKPLRKVGFIGRNFLPLLFGIFSVLGSTLCLGLFFFKHWWMFFALLLAAFIQTIYAVGMNMCIEVTKNPIVQKERNSILRACGGFYCLIIFVGLLCTFIPSFTRGLMMDITGYNYFVDNLLENPHTGYFIEVPETPGALTITLSIFLFIWIGVGLSETQKIIKTSPKHLPKPFFITVLLIVIFEIIMILEVENIFLTTSL